MSFAIFFVEKNHWFYLGTVASEMTSCNLTRSGRVWR